MRARGRLAVLGLALVCAACGNPERFRESIGIVAPPPDEFLVVAREPLRMPPSLNALPTPQPGAPSLVEPNPQLRAQQALAGQGQAPAAGAQASASETALVTAAGPGDPMIRSTIETEANQQSGVRRFGLDSFFGIPIVQNPEASGAIDAREEAERLRQQGLAVPTIPPAAP
jgi:hypothetical protein